MSEERLDPPINPPSPTNESINQKRSLSLSLSLTLIHSLWSVKSMISFIRQAVSEWAREKEETMENGRK